MLLNVVDLTVRENTNSLQPVTIGGYTLPTDTAVLPHLFAVMRNGKLFAEPKRFRPERFLRDDGSLDTAAVEQVNVLLYINLLSRFSQTGSHDLLTRQTVVLGRRISSGGALPHVRLSSATLSLRTGRRESTTAERTLRCHHSIDAVQRACDCFVMFSSSVEKTLIG